MKRAAGSGPCRSSSTWPSALLILPNVALGGFFLAVGYVAVNGFRPLLDAMWRVMQALPPPEILAVIPAGGVVALGLVAYVMVRVAALFPLLVTALGTASLGVVGVLLGLGETLTSPFTWSAVAGIGCGVGQLYRLRKIARFGLPAEIR